MYDPPQGRDDLRRSRMQARLLVSHFFAYCVGVCMFAMLNMLFGGSAWFQWPSLGWGLLLVVHVLAVVTGGHGRPSTDG